MAPTAFQLRHSEPQSTSVRSRSFEPWREERRHIEVAFEEWGTAWNSAVEPRERAAQRVCGEVVKAFWRLRTEDDERWFTPWRSQPPSLPLLLRRLAREAAARLQALSLIEAEYLISTLYTVLLPPRVRAARGAYYTPPVLAEHLLDLAAAEGVDWSTARVLDPACGGGAFLTPVAARMLGDHRLRCLNSEERLGHLERCLAGIEIDGFAAWMTRTFVQLVAYPDSCSAGRPLHLDIRESDALELVLRDTRRFDLILGNPPYGRVRLTSRQREAFSRSLYGHANLYGVFLDAALRWRSAGAWVAFVTPTSFLGGQYFSRLRDVLLREAPPLVIDVVRARTGVFEAVQQETCLALFGPNPDRTATVHLLEASDFNLRSRRAGLFPLPQSRGEPWLLPRSPRQARLAARASKLKTRLHHLGYKASTGPLVWNRHKAQLRSRPGVGTYPLIWAEAVRPGCFNFEYRSRAHAPFFHLHPDQPHLVTCDRCVLVQRTTAKEQKRRLVACAVPETFFARWGKVVVENHVNILRAVDPSRVQPAALAAVLNTETVDQVFRCLSGTVAVSVTELHALPLPPREVFQRVASVLEHMEEEPKRQHEIERLVARAYGTR